MYCVLPVVLLAGCARASASAPASLAVAEPAPLVMAHVIPGEAMEYEVALRGITIGRVVVAAGEIGRIEEQRAIVVRARGQSAGLAAIIGEVTWEMRTTLDLDRGYLIDSHEEMILVFAGQTEHESEDYHSSHDLLSAIGALRAWHSQPGATAKISAHVASAETTGTLVDAAHEYLGSAERPAVRYAGVFDERFPVTTWISDDIARVPLRFECDTPLGRVTGELVEYRAPPG